VRNFLSSAVSCLVISAVLLPLAGCIAHAPNSGQQQILVTVASLPVSPASVNVSTPSSASTVQYTATVKGTSNTGVTWTLADYSSASTVCTATGSGLGTFVITGTNTMTYTAPQTVPVNPCGIVVTATSNEDTTAAGQGLVNVSVPAIVVTVTSTPASPASVSVSTPSTPSTVQYTAAVTGTTDTAVTWSLADYSSASTLCTATGSGLGTITTTGTNTMTYTAPQTVPVSPCGIVVTATSNESPTSTGQALVNVDGLPITVTLSPASVASIPVSTLSASSTVQYTATVTGTSNPVTWSLIADPNALTVCSATGTGLGTIAATGSFTATYTAPSTLPQSPCAVLVTATASANSITAQANTQVNVHVSVSITPATDTIGQGANLQYTATVIGAPSTDQAVTWSATQGEGGFDQHNPGLYIAPGLVAGTNTETVTITATPTFDPSQPGTATTTVQQTDPLGTVSEPQTMSSCPADSNGGLANGTCYSMTVSCDGIADLPTYLKVNPAADPIGTVLFLIGQGGSGFYDNNPLWTWGYQTVEKVSAASFNTVQISFGAPFDNGTQPNGWLQGPGGVRRLACRYATVADWVYNNPKTINPDSSATTSAPLCATGNGGGSGAVAYAAYQYGLGGKNTTGPAQEFTMIEPTSGPLMTRLDLGCVCDTNVNGPLGPCTSDTAPAPMCYTPSDAAIIDTAYQVQGQTNPPTLCSDGLSGTVTANFNRFASDSIDWAPFNPNPIPLSQTMTVNMRFGGDDQTTAVPQGMYWYAAVRPVPTTYPACTDDAPQEIPFVQDGADNIASDIIAGCVPPAAKSDEKSKHTGTRWAPSTER
jgi:hypothetical protein